MKAIYLIFRETLAAGQFEMESHVLVFIDEQATSIAILFQRYAITGDLRHTNTTVWDMSTCRTLWKLFS